LRQRERATHAELQSIIDQTSDRATYLRLAETLAGFLTRLRSSAETLDVHERQRIVRLLVKEVLVGDDTIIIRHSIPIPTTPSTDGHSPPTPTGGTSTSQCYLLRSGRERPALRRSPVPLLDHAARHDPAVQIGPDQPDDAGVPDRFPKAVDEDVVVDPIEGNGHRLPVTVIFRYR